MCPLPLHLSSDFIVGDVVLPVDFTFASFYIYIRQLGDTNLQACACDLQNFQFCCFRAMAIYDCETECSFIYLIQNGKQLFVRGP